MKKNICVVLKSLVIVGLLFGTIKPLQADAPRKNLTQGHRGIAPSNSPTDNRGDLVELNQVLEAACDPATEGWDDTTPPCIDNIEESDDPIKKEGCGCPNTVTIWADVTDESNLEWVRLYYLPVGANSWEYVEMSLCSGCTYEATIGPFSEAGTVRYRVKAQDCWGNEARSSRETVTVEDCDTTPPDIDNIRASPDPINREGCPEPTIVTIRADVTDDESGVKWVHLFYQEPEGGSWRLRIMDLESGDTYKATLGPFSQAGTLKYRIEARDNEENEAQSDTQTVTVNDCQQCATHHFRGEVIQRTDDPGATDHGFIVRVTEILAETPDLDIEVDDEIFVWAEENAIETSSPSVGDTIEVLGHVSVVPCIPPIHGCDAIGIRVEVACDEYLLVIGSKNPVVQQVQPCFTGAYWPSGAYVDNRFTAHVDWQGTEPGLVYFTLNDDTRQESLLPGTLDVAAHTYNMGADLQYGILGTRNWLHVAAHPQSGSPSNPYTQILIGYGPPRWLPQGTLFQAIFYADCPEKPLHFCSEWSWEFPIHGQVAPPTWFPFIGGQSLGLRKPKVRFREDVFTDGTGRLEGGGEGGLNVAGQEIFGRLTLGGEGRVTEGQGLQITAADIKGEIGGRLKKKWPVLDLICKAFTSGVCPLQEAESLPLVGDIVKSFNELVKVKAQIEPATRLETSLHTTPDGWVWDWLNAGGRIKMTVGLSAKIFEILQAEAYGGGEPDFSLKLLPDPGLDQVTARLFAGLKLSAFRWKGIYEAGYQWCYPETQCLAAGRSVQCWTRTIPWQPIPRDYAKDPATYAVFQANMPVASALKPSTAQETTETLIAANVYPHSNPALAADGAVLLLWVHDDVGKPIMQGEEIYYSLHDGASWSTPDGITGDTLQDFNPQVAFDDSGQAVAVWERVKTTQTVTSTLDITYTQAIEIAYAVWDDSTIVTTDSNGWTAPTLLTDNDALDHSPVLARGSNGKLMLVWRQNAGGEMLGTAASPDALYVAFWNGSAWTAPQAVLSGVSGLLGLSAAYYDDSRATLVYARDTDGDLTTATDQELFALTWDGAVWSGPTRLTSDSQPDTSPTTLYDTEGNVRLLWLKGDTLYALFDSLSGTGLPVVVEDSAAIFDYAVTIDTRGNLVLVWQGLSPEGGDIYYATYDAAHEVFSLEQQLTHDRSMEKSLAPIFAPTSELLIAYGEDELITTTVTISPTLVISNVTTFGQSDLYVLRHNLGPDLVLEATDIVLSAPNPAPGSTVTITATLHNQGDLAVANPEVAFYLGDPDTDGTQIGTLQATPIALAGGMTTTLSVEWTVPAGGPFAIYAVADPAGTVDEWDEANNKAYITSVTPDLIVQDVAVGYGVGQGITLTTTISNAGVVNSDAFAIAFRLNDPMTGTLLADTTIAGLGAGVQAQASVSRNALVVSSGWHKVYAVADAGSAIVEADETNNIGWASLAMLPDLAVYPAGIVTDTNELGGTAVSVWVHNEGIRDAIGVAVGLYTSSPVPGTMPLTHTVVSVPSGESRVANLNLDQRLLGFYVGVNIDGEIEERDPANNVALVGQMLIGSVSLQGRPSRPDSAWVTSLQASFYEPGSTTPRYTHQVTTDQNGQFDLSDISPGTYDIRVKGSHTLANIKHNVTLQPGINVISFGTLLEGDANNDNCVNAPDFSIMRTAFGQCQGQSGYDASADFNQDGCVNAPDFSLLRTNFDLCGDITV